MAVINLHEKYEKKIAQRFQRHSILNGRLSSAYSFLGAKTVKLSGIATVAMHDYAASGSNRYGTTEDVGDTLQELTLTKKRSFSAVIDKTQSVDQAIDKAAIFLKTQIDEVVTPERETWQLGRFAQMGGHIVGDAAAITEANVVKRLNAARAYENSKHVPTTGRTWYVTGAVYSALVESPYFHDLEKIGEKALVEGQVGRIFGAPVVEVPDDVMPANVNFMLIHKDSAIDPIKLEHSVVNTKPQGYAGTLIEFVCYYDGFVIGERADGVYVDVDTGSGKGTVLAAPAIAADGDITVLTGCSCKYTTDGSDPRYSSTAVTISATTTTGIGTSGTVVKAVQTKDGAFASPVAMATVA